MNFHFNNLRVTSSYYYEKSEAHYALKDISDVIHIDGNYNGCLYKLLFVDASFMS